MCASAAERSCPWCRVYRNNIDELASQIPINEQQSRPKLLDLRNEQNGNSRRKSETYNMFKLSTDFTEPKQDIPVVPPLLHIKIGLVNKILAICDKIVERLNHKFDIEELCESPFDHHLDMTLSSCVIKRENYRGRKLSGRACSRLMSNLADVVNTFLSAPCIERRSIKDEVGYLDQLTDGLSTCAKLWSDTDSGSRGIGFCLSYQGEWNNELLTRWEFYLKSFCLHLKQQYGDQKKLELIILPTRFGKFL